MSTLLIAVLAINGALVLYTIGVWAERVSRTLKPWHLLFFWGGLSLDLLGTSAMGALAGGFSLNLHGITGAVAFVLMAVHAVWATVTLLRNEQGALHRFHKFSLVVWALWLIPFVTGALLNSRSGGGS